MSLKTVGPRASRGPDPSPSAPNYIESLGCRTIFPQSSDLIFSYLTQFNEIGCDENICIY